MLRQSRLLRVQNTVELAQRQIAGGAHHAVLAQIPDQCRTMHLLEREPAQRKNLPSATLRVCDGDHAILVTRMPERIPPRFCEKLCAHAAGHFVAANGMVADRPFRLVHQPHLSEVDHRPPP